MLNKCLLFSVIDVFVQVNINWSVQIKSTFLRSQYFCPWLPKLIDVWNKELVFYIYGRLLSKREVKMAAYCRQAFFGVFVGDDTGYCERNWKQTKHIPCASRLQLLQSAAGQDQFVRCEVYMK